MKTGQHSDDAKTKCYGDGKKEATKGSDEEQ
jgi:hypothetical protein